MLSVAVAKLHLWNPAVLEALIDSLMAHAHMSLELLLINPSRARPWTLHLPRVLSNAAIICLNMFTIIKLVSEAITEDHEIVHGTRKEWSIDPANVGCADADCHFTAESRSLELVSAAMFVELAIGEAFAFDWTIGPVN